MKLFFSLISLFLLLPTSSFAQSFCGKNYSLDSSLSSIGNFPFVFTKDCVDDHLSRLHQQRFGNPYQETIISMGGKGGIGAEPILCSCAPINTNPFYEKSFDIEKYKKATEGIKLKALGASIKKGFYRNYAAILEAEDSIFSGEDLVKEVPNCNVEMMFKNIDSKVKGNKSCNSEVLKQRVHDIFGVNSLDEAKEQLKDKFKPYAYNQKTDDNSCVPPKLYRKLTSENQAVDYTARNESTYMGNHYIGDHTSREWFDSSYSTSSGGMAGLRRFRKDNSIFASSPLLFFGLSDDKFFVKYVESYKKFIKMEQDKFYAELSEEDKKQVHFNDRGELQWNSRFGDLYDKWQQIKKKGKAEFKNKFLASKSGGAVLKKNLSAKCDEMLSISDFLCAKEPPKLSNHASTAIYHKATLHAKNKDGEAFPREIADIMLLSDSIKENCVPTGYPQGQKYFPNQTPYTSPLENAFDLSNPFDSSISLYEKEDSPYQNFNRVFCKEITAKCKDGKCSNKEIKEGIEQYLGAFKIDINSALADMNGEGDGKHLRAIHKLISRDEQAGAYSSELKENLLSLYKNASELVSNDNIVVSADGETTSKVESRSILAEEDGSSSQDSFAGNFLIDGTIEDVNAVIVARDSGEPISYSRKVPSTRGSSSRSNTSARTNSPTESILPTSSVSSTPVQESFSDNNNDSFDRLQEQRVSSNKSVTKKDTSTPKTNFSRSSFSPKVVNNSSIPQSETQSTNRTSTARNVSDSGFKEREIDKLKDELTKLKKDISVSERDSKRTFTGNGSLGSSETSRGNNLGSGAFDRVTDTSTFGGGSSRSPASIEGQTTNKANDFGSSAEANSGIESKDSDRGPASKGAVTGNGGGSGGPSSGGGGGNAVAVGARGSNEAAQLLARDLDRLSQAPKEFTDKTYELPYVIPAKILENMKWSPEDGPSKTGVAREKRNMYKELRLLGIKFRTIEENKSMSADGKIDSYYTIRVYDYTHESISMSSMIPFKRDSEKSRLELLKAVRPVYKFGGHIFDNWVYRHGLVEQFDIEQKDASFYLDREFDNQNLSQYMSDLEKMNE